MNLRQLLDGIPHERGAIRIHVVDSCATVSSSLADGAHDYVHSARVHGIEDVPLDSLRGLLATAELEVSVVVFHLDAAQARVGHQFLVPGRSPILAPPEGTRFVRFGLRVRGPGSTRLFVASANSAGTEEDTSFAVSSTEAAVGLRIAIHGSCVSRDAFALAEASGLTLDAYYARCSLGSLFAPACKGDLPLGKIPSAFQRRVVSYDLDKAAQKYFAAGKFDALVHDPIDERFALACFSDGWTATISNEFRAMGIPTSSYRTIPSGSEEHYAMWEHGWRGLLSTLDAGGALNKLRVIQVFWAKEVEGYPGVLPGASLAEVERGNRYLARLYSRMREDLPRDQFVEFDEALFVVDPAHKWGITPFHYPKRFYLALLSGLRASLGAPSGGSD